MKNVGVYILVFRVEKKTFLFNHHCTILHSLQFTFLRPVKSSFVFYEAVSSILLPKKMMIIILLITRIDNVVISAFSIFLTSLLTPSSAETEDKDDEDSSFKKST